MLLSGCDFAPLFLQSVQRTSEKQNPRRLFWRWFANKQLGNQKVGRKGPWKLVLNKKGTALYNLDQDTAETRDLMAGHPEILKELSHALEQWEETLKDDKITVKKINELHS